MARAKEPYCKCGVLKTDANTGRNGDYFRYLCKACDRHRILMSKYDKLSFDELEALRIMHASNTEIVDEYIIGRFGNDCNR